MKVIGLYEAFKTNKKAESEGIWVDYGETGASFKIARIGGDNAAYGRYLAGAIKPFKHQLQTGTMQEEKAQEIYINAFVATVLKDWKGVTDEKGKEMAFNEENAKKLFKDLPVLYENLSKEASDFENYKRRMDEETVKNSAKPSTGN